MPSNYRSSLAQNSFLICLSVGMFFVTWMKAPANFALLGAFFSLLIASRWQKSKQLDPYYQPLVKRPCFLAIMAFLGVALVGTFIGQNHGFPSSWINEIGPYSYRIALFLCLMSLTWQTHWKKYVLNSFIIGTTIACIFFSWSIHLGLWRGGHFALHFLGHSLTLSLSLTNSVQVDAIVSIAFYFALYRLFQGKFSKTKPLFIICLIIIATYLIFFNTERTAYTTLIALICIFIFQKLPFKLIYIGLISLIIIAAVAYIISPNIQTKVSTTYHNTAAFFNLSHNDSTKKIDQASLTSVGQRLHIAKNSIKLIEKRPFWGYGTLNFGGAYELLHDKVMKMAGRPYDIADPDNSYIQILVENGIIGLLALIMFLLAAIREGKSQSTEDRHFITATVIWVVILGLTGETIVDYQVGLFLFTFLGMFLGKTIPKPK